MKTIRAIFDCVERVTLSNLLRYQIVLAITAAIEAINVILVASLVSYLLTGERNFALIEAAELMAHVGLIEDTARLSVQFVAYVAVTIVASSVLGIINIFVLSHIAADAGRRLANRILHTFLKAPPHDVLGDGPSSVTKLLTLETQRVTDHIFQNVAQINARIYTAIVVCGVLVYTSAAAFFVSAALFSITYLILVLIVRRKLGAFGTSISKINATRLKVIEEMTFGYKEIKSLSAERHFDHSLAREHADYAQMYRNLNLIYNTPRFVIELIIFICLTLLTAVSISSYANESSADISQFLPIFGLAALKLLPIFQQLYTGYAQARAHSPAAVVISEFFRKSNSLQTSPSSIANSPTQKELLPPATLDQAVGDIAFDSLTFRYNDMDEGFSFNFHIKKGAINFVVGPSGAGKTTLLEVLSDLRAPSSGTLAIGEERFDLTETSLRADCSYSTQRSFCVAGTVKENLTLGRSVSDDDLSRAIEQSQLSEFLLTLPQGLETPIGNGVRELSVGQIQRLGLARHLLMKRRILILDEPTSNLDQKTADSVFLSLREIAKTTFVVCVTHDTDRVQPDDHIIRVSAGSTATERSKDQS